jgi:hypothetical protein
VTALEAAISDHPASSASAGNGGDAARTLALGRELTEAHESLRQALRRLRTGVGSPGRSLRTHCVAFCSAVARHHTSEDRDVFPALAAQVPELGSVLAELQQDHHLVAGILQRVEQLAGDSGPDDAYRVRAELDGLAAILESHFRWEERRLVAALNSLDTSGLTTKDLFGRTLPPGCRLPGQAFDGATFALAALRASASSVAVKIVTDSPIKVAPRTRAAVSESPSQKTALASPKTGIRFTIMPAGAARTRAMA